MLDYFRLKKERQEKLAKQVQELREELGIAANVLSKYDRYGMYNVSNSRPIVDRKETVVGRLEGRIKELENQVRLQRTYELPENTPKAGQVIIMDANSPRHETRNYELKWVVEQVLEHLGLDVHTNPKECTEEENILVEAE